MLAGFSYPIDELQFSVNLPGAIDQDPQFVSGYHQTNIEKDLTYSVSGSNIAGRSWTSLKDHETLLLRLSATEELFPQSRVELPEADGIPMLIWICAGLALVYWLLFLRNFLPLWGFPAVAPEGFGAGQMGTILTKSGANLSLMVFSWAQLGYVVLQMDRRGKVVNGAFVVCGASAFAAHLGFALSTEPDMAPALLAAKLFGGLLAVIVAFAATKEENPT